MSTTEEEILDCVMPEWRWVAAAERVSAAMLAEREESEDED